LGSLIPLPINCLRLESFDGFFNLQPFDPSPSSMSLIFYVIINDIDDFVWCTNGFAIFVQCFVQYSIESFDKFVINVFELHPKTSAQLVGKLFNPYIF
jgi:hypothetical protein